MKRRRRAFFACATRGAFQLGLLGIVASLLSGCVFMENPQDRAIEKSPNFKSGYSDGCASANMVSANMREQSDVRDRALFKSDRAYRTGWSAGYTACRPANLDMPEPNQGPIPDPYPPR